MTPCHQAAVRPYYSIAVYFHVPLLISFRQQLSASGLHLSSIVVVKVAGGEVVGNVTLTVFMMLMIFWAKPLHLI